ncbi:hypothetical protein [Flexithrix dorotheae]|uniref:hypothetical protein n=1 Tax=Flexithrix dorotheae TaxID=70993 RepID=UPI00037E51AF|nr:hypothetical protein [Flexithrix dorotheae]
MVSIFRINDPFRILGIFVVLLLLRLPMIINGLPLIIPELSWLLVGEKLGNGSRMYVDVWENIAPLSAGIYWLIDLVFGKSQIAYQVISSFLVLIQAIIFNQALIKTGVYKEKTYLPGLLYVVFMSISFDFLTLSPVLMANTYLILVVRNLFRFDNEAIDQDIFKTGFYIGIAALLYIPSTLFLIMAILGLAMFKTSSSRYLIMMVYGFTFAFIIYLVYLFTVGGIGDFYDVYILSFLSLNLERYFSPTQSFWLVLVPGIALVLGLLKARTERGFVNFQSNAQQLMAIWILASIFTLLITPKFATYQFIIFVPAFTFFTVHYLLLFKKRIFAEIAFWVISILVVFISYNGVYNFSSGLNPIDYDRLTVKKEESLPEKNKKILVLGNHLSYYQHQSIATPYYNWKLSQRHFGNMDTYSTLIEIYKNFEKDFPEIIVDKSDNQFASKLFNNIPLLEEKYEKSNENDFPTYILKGSLVENGAP